MFMILGLAEPGKASSQQVFLLAKDETERHFLKANQQTLDPASQLAISETLGAVPWQNILLVSTEYVIKKR